MGLRIAFILKFPLNSFSKRGNVLGDELYALSLAKAVMEISTHKITIIGKENLIENKYDLLIYLNDYFPKLDSSECKKILYLQNGYPEGSLNRLRTFNLDKFIQIWVLSDFLKHKVERFIGKDNVRVLPFGSIIDPLLIDKNKDLTCEISYLGNDIKGRDKTLQYFEPCFDFDFRIYGNWKRRKRAFLKSFFIDQTDFKYMKKIQPYAKGKIDQKFVSNLYKNSKINLNLTIDDIVENEIVNLRILDVLNCGGFLISDSKPPNLSKGYLLSNGGIPLQSTIREFLKYPKLREEISQQGKEIVRDSWLIQNSAEKLCGFLDEI